MVAARSHSQICILILSAFTLVSAVVFVAADSLSPSGRRLASIQGVDPVGYFGMSHALLFHQSYDLSDEYSRLKPRKNAWTGTQNETGHPGSAWAIGYSIAAIPFLAAGTLLDKVLGNPVDGYSRFAILTYCLTNVMVTGAGLIALFLFLRDTAGAWHVSESRASINALVTTFATFFGTNVGYYAVSPMSHAVTFSGVSLFLMLWWRIRERTDLKSWALLGLIGGFLSISRWQDLLFLGGPILFDLSRRPASLLRPLIWSRLFYAGAAALCWIPQLMAWKYIFGGFTPHIEPTGGFGFPGEFLLKVLFSTHDGWVMWTPIVFIGMCGLIVGLTSKTRLFLPWIVVLAMELTLVGSLAAWDGGGGFSIRYLTSSAPLIAFGVMTLLCLLSGRTRTLLLTGIGVCCLFALDSAVEFKLNLIPQNGELTFSEYWTDRFRIGSVLRRKAAVRQATALQDQGSPQAALEVLESAKAHGPDRDVLNMLHSAYLAARRFSDAEKTRRQSEDLLNSRLY